MDIFFAFVILLNAVLMIGWGYYLWTAADRIQKLIEEAVRKQDDRLRKRFGSTVNGQKTGENIEATGPQSESGGEEGRSRPRAGESRRRRY